MERIIILFFTLVSINIFAETEILTNDSLGKELHLLKTDFQGLKLDSKKLKTKISILENQLLMANKIIDSLHVRTQMNSRDIAKKADDLGVKIATTEQIANKRINEVDQSLSTNSLYGIIGVLSAILLSGVLYWLLSKRQKSDKIEVVGQLSKTQSSIEESLVKEFGKQTNLIESELQLLAQHNAGIQTTNIVPDHSLALKVASEINLIERNINLMDKGIKGLKQLERSIDKLKDNLSANGYDMPELLGKQYHQGMKVIVASSIPDENIEIGSEIITKILIPQVNFNDRMIQTAQIEVSVGS